MARNYDIDPLGWLQFQQLCQSLLEDAGVLDLAWSGNADGARSAFSEGDVALPSIGGALPGPVHISATWVREGSRLRRRGGTPPTGEPYIRSAESALRSIWEAIYVNRRRDRRPHSVLVLTNASRGQLNRRLAAKALSGLVEDANIVVAGPDELSAELDARPRLRRAFPATLGLRDLRALLSDATLERSTLEFAEAVKLSRIFVATGCYRRTLDVLDTHSFVVLTGPPEMGKTAIARIIGLAQLTAGWEAHECTHPDQVLGNYRRDRPQVFIADDAFGSTEYRPDTAERWTRELSGLLSRMDDRHWLIWTSRPAPLRAGLRRLHRERGLERFPNPSDVQVDARDLEIHEKALILLRHAKANDLAESVVRFIRAEGPAIVSHPYFTPERIRRFVATKCVDEPSSLGSAAGSDVVRGELRRPTEAMAQSLQALESEQRDLLIAMLDAPDHFLSERDLVAALRRHHDGGLTRPPAEIVDRLTDHFLSVSDGAVTWVHPSWRDLVIDYLAADEKRRRKFLDRSDLEGILLAVSSSGGASGTRVFPLLTDDADWDVLSGRLWKLVPTFEEPDLTRLLWSLAEAVESAADPYRAREVQSLATAVLELTRRRFDEHAIPLTVFEAWVNVATRLDRPVAPPASWILTWAELVPSSPLRLESIAALERVNEWLRLAELLACLGPEHLAAVGFPERYKALIERIAPAAHESGVILETAPGRALLLRTLDRLAEVVAAPPDDPVLRQILVSRSLGDWRGEAEIEWSDSLSRERDVSVARILQDL